MSRESDGNAILIESWAKAASQLLSFATCGFLRLKLSGY